MATAEQGPNTAALDATAPLTPVSSKAGGSGLGGLAGLMGVIGALSAMQKPLAPNLAPPSFSQPLSDFKGSGPPLQAGYYKYGTAPGLQQNQSFSPYGARFPVRRAQGGGALSMGGAQEGYVQDGPGSGQDDLVPAMLSPKEYILDATTMSRLGDGNPDEGARRVDGMRAALAKQSGSKHVVPPKAKSPLQYLKQVA
jgi:hypothetical protein